MKIIQMSGISCAPLAAAVSLACAGAIVPQTSAFAAAADAGESLETIVVTAQKREQRDIDVPASVSAISADTLTSLGQYRVEDFAAEIPGLSLTSLKPGENQFTIRGITTGLNQSAPSTSIYIDEAPIGSVNAYTAGSQLAPDLDPALLNRIEVLKGPQGTLYGAGAMGGMVRFVTVGPDFENLTGSLTVGGNTVAHGGDGWLGRFYVNIPLASSMALQLSGFDREDAGYIKDLNGRKDVNQSHTSGGRIAYTWRLGDDWKISAWALTQRVTDGDNSTEDVNAQTLRPVYASLTQNVLIPQPTKDQYDVYNITVHGKVAFFDLVSSTTYQTINANATGDATDEYGALLGGLLGIPDFGTSIGQVVNTDRWSEELRLDAHALDEKLLYEIGGYFTKENDTNRIPGLDPFSTLTLQPIALPFYFLQAQIDSTYREFSEFANVTYDFTPRFSIQGGVRYSEDHQVYDQNYSGLLIGLTPLIVTGARERGDKTTYLGTASYKVTADDVVYVRVATGYRPGGPNAVPPPSVYVAPTTYAPDTLISYEAGYKSVMADGKVSLEAALFKTDWKSIQIQTSQDNFQFFVNGGSATSKGAEATLLVNPFAGFSVRATAAYTDAYLTADAPLAEGMQGDELPWVPRITASFAPQYRWRIGGGWSAIAGGSADYTGKRRSDFSGRAPVEVPAYTTLNLTGSVEREQWRFTVYGKNLSDSEGITYLAARTLALGVTPYEAGIIQPRTFGIEANYRF